MGGKGTKVLRSERRSEWGKKWRGKTKAATNGMEKKQKLFFSFLQPRGREGPSHAHSQANEVRKKKREGDRERRGKGRGRERERERKVRDENEKATLST